MIMSELVPVLSEESIAGLVTEMAEKLSEDYSGMDLIMIGVLKGGIHFLSDLVRKMRIPVKLDFLQAASYGSGTCSSGSIRLQKDIDISIKDSHVLVVEDIVDTGRTLTCLIDHLKSFQPASVKLCALIDKTERREVSLSVDYACHAVDHGFLVGYGMDFDEKYRHLPALYHMIKE